MQMKYILCTTAAFKLRYITYFLRFYLHVVFIKNKYSLIFITSRNHCINNIFLLSLPLKVGSLECIHLTNIK